MSALGQKQTSRHFLEGGVAKADVRFWHKADVARLSGKADIDWATTVTAIPCSRVAVNAVGVRAMSGLPPIAGVATRRRLRALRCSDCCHRCWEQLDCHCHSRAERLHQPVERR